ncbi:MAG: hypothetical protein JOY90_35620 [Bradyrhizobium sp.]|uniref:hypothetical protein n=1 Tax=Bradyrhizobium sp. TaxID=376 RepID=UPI001E19F869|nr:hypothetical protein [Bradyrhizobium sp.]MBV9565745.1 hypothetical protein [Bradyrhizobium sp.]
MRGMNDRAARLLERSACGATGTAGCDCPPDAVYIRAGMRAAEAVKANPEMSDRAIAKAIGLSDKTVAAARKAGAEFSAVGTRTGRDDKTRVKPRPTAEAACRTVCQLINREPDPAARIKLIAAVIAELHAMSAEAYATLGERKPQEEERQENAESEIVH